MHRFFVFVFKKNIAKSSFVLILRFYAVLNTAFSRKLKFGWKTLSFLVFFSSSYFKQNSIINITTSIAMPHFKDKSLKSVKGQFWDLAVLIL